MNEALDPIAIDGRAAVIFTNPTTGEAVAIDATWLHRAAIHVRRSEGCALGVSAALAVFLADCEPRDGDEAAIIAAAQVAARHFTEVRDVLIADLESLDRPSGPITQDRPGNAPDAGLTLPGEPSGVDPEPDWVQAAEQLETSNPDEWGPPGRARRLLAEYPDETPDLSTPNNSAKEGPA